VRGFDEVAIQKGSEMRQMDLFMDDRKYQKKCPELLCVIIFDRYDHFKNCTVVNLGLTPTLVPKTILNLIQLE